MPYQTYQPKKTFRSFRDLEVYQKSMECSVITVKNFKVSLTKLKYPFLENMINCSMYIPLQIGEASTMRYNDFSSGIALMEKAMANCNKMSIYFEQAKGLYGDKINGELAEDLIRRYTETRNKMFRLEKSWEKYHREYFKESDAKKAPKNF